MFKNVKFNVSNNIPGIDINVEPKDGGYLITVKKQGRARLGNVELGKTVTIGDKEYIVLGHGKDTTAITTKKFFTRIPFGSFADYRKSEVREILNKGFYSELAKSVGKENIIPHTVDLSAEDGTGKGSSCKDNVSLLTTSLYRRYREFLPAYGDWWWTATPVSYENGCSRNVCCVGVGGALGWSNCDYSNGVRPFCILNSSVVI